MKFRGSRILFIWVIILSGSVLLVLVGSLSLSRYLEREIHEAINLQNGKVSSIQVKLWKRSLRINNLEWSSVPDSLNSSPHNFRCQTVLVKGISVYQLLANKTIRVNEIVLDSGKLRYNNSIKKIHQAYTSAYKVFECNTISLKTIEMHVMADTLVSFSALLTLRINDATVTLDSMNDVSYSAKNSFGNVRNINFSRHEGMYGGSIKKLFFNTREQKIIIDSVLLIPNFSKYSFAQFLGEQAGRLNISIPKLTLEGVAFDSLADSTFIASKISIESFDLFSFKDKRVPFLRDYTIPLPMEIFTNLSWKVKVDSILVTNSRITIEEYPAKGDERTSITFNDMNASFTGLNNRINENEHPYAQLNVNALLMNAGKIDAVFQFPLDATSPYTAEGNISRFSLAELNPVFIPIANIRIESGQLNSLTFDFKYTDRESKGKLDIDYENLRLLGLNKNNAETNNIKTFFINVLIKKNRDQSGVNAKAVGIINIERDRRRLIFHVWWRSILDGLHSSLVGQTKRTRQDKRDEREAIKKQER
jgi:hypothetical protein